MSLIGSNRTGRAHSTTTHSTPLPLQFTGIIQSGGAVMGTGSLRNDTNIHPQPSSYAQLQQALSVMQKKQKKPCSEGERVSRSLTSTVQSAFHSHLRCNRIPSCSLVKMSTGHVWKLVKQRDMVGVSVGGV